jgi:thioredoxin reductase (NADPH)
MSTYLSRRVQTCGNIEILFNTEIRKMSGGKMLEEAELENTKTGERRIVKTPAIFSMIGANPCTEWLPTEIERDDKGFIKTGAEVANAPGWKENKPAALETSVPNIFAAGDVRSGSVKRCAAALGEGGMAIADVHVALATYVNQFLAPGKASQMEMRISRVITKAEHKTYYEVLATWTPARAKARVAPLVRY